MQRSQWNQNMAVAVVFSSLFIDALLLTIPVPFLSVNLASMGYSDIQIGLLFGSKALFNIISNPFWGYMVHRIGTRVPLLAGTAIFVGSSFLFAFSQNSYLWLFISRSLQGVGSSAAFSAGMTFLAKTFTTDEERGSKMGIAMAGVGLAVLVGPPVGGGLYTLGGHPLPFIVTGAISCIQFILQFLYVRFIRTSDLESKSINLKESLKANASYLGDNHNEIRYSDLDGYPVDEIDPLPSCMDLLAPFKDPMVLIVFGTLLLANGCISMLEFLLPIYLHSKIGLSELWMGLILLPSTITYFILTPILGRIAGRWGRSMIIGFGLFVLGATLAVLPFSDTFWLELILIAGTGVGMSFVDGSCFVLLATLIDTRHNKTGSHSYGLVFAAADASFSIGYLLGSFGGSSIQYFFGFTWLMRGAGFLLIAYSPLLYYVRGIQVIEEPELGIESLEEMSFGN